MFVLGSAVYYPRAYSAELRRHFELVFIDGRHFVPGYAPPADVLSQVDLGTFADDVEAVRQALGYGEIIVVGHSVHGQIALEYADRYPESTSRVVLIGAVPYRFSDFAGANDRVWEELASPERRTLLEARLATLDEVVAAAPATRSFAVLTGNCCCAGSRGGEVSDRLWFVTSARRGSLLYPFN
jgi:proline iminopeptidase